FRPIQLPRGARGAQAGRRSHSAYGSRARYASFAGSNAGRDRAAPHPGWSRRGDRRARRRCAGPSAAPEERGCPSQSALRSNGAWYRIPARALAVDSGHEKLTMTTLDVGLNALRTGVSALRSLVGRASQFHDRASVTFKAAMPKGLFARALL